jgi:hypothetical protein
MTRVGNIPGASSIADLRDDVAGAGLTCPRWMTSTRSPGEPTGTKQSNADILFVIGHRGHSLPNGRPRVQGDPAEIVGRGDAETRHDHGH